MSKIKNEGISVIWMATGLDSLKTKDFQLNDKGGLCFFKDGNSVGLTGDVEIIKDEKIKQELWQDWFIDHFNKGSDDPNYILIKFVANHATFWIDGKFIHRKL